MIWIYAWFATGFLYTVYCMAKESFREDLVRIAPTWRLQALGLTAVTLVGPVIVAFLVVAIVIAWTRYWWYKSKSRRLRQKARVLEHQTNEVVESAFKLLDDMKENVHIRCDQCGHASKPVYFNTAEGEIACQWSCPQCGRKEEFDRKS